MSPREIGREIVGTFKDRPIELALVMVIGALLAIVYFDHRSRETLNDQLIRCIPVESAIKLCEAGK